MIFPPTTTKHHSPVTHDLFAQMPRRRGRRSTRSRSAVPSRNDSAACLKAAYGSMLRTRESNWDAKPLKHGGRCPSLHGAFMADPDSLAYRKHGGTSLASIWPAFTQEPNAPVLPNLTATTCEYSVTKAWPHTPTATFSSPPAASCADSSSFTQSSFSVSQSPKVLLPPLSSSLTAVAALETPGEAGAATAAGIVAEATENTGAKIGAGVQAETEKKAEAKIEASAQAEAGAKVGAKAQVEVEAEIETGAAENTVAMPKAVTAVDTDAVLAPRTDSSAEAKKMSAVEVDTSDEHAGQIYNRQSYDKNYTNAIVHFEAARAIEAAAKQDNESIESDDGIEALAQQDDESAENDGGTNPEEENSEEESILVRAADARREKLLETQRKKASKSGEWWRANAEIDNATSPTSSIPIRIVRRIGGIQFVGRFEKFDAGYVDCRLVLVNDGSSTTVETTQWERKVEGADMTGARFDRDFCSNYMDSWVHELSDTIGLAARLPPKQRRATIQEMSGGVANFIRVATRIQGHSFLVQFSRPIASSFSETVEAKLLHVRSGLVRCVAGDLPPQGSFNRDACMKLLESWVSTKADAGVSAEGSDVRLRLDDLPEVPLLVQATTVLQCKPEAKPKPSSSELDKWPPSRDFYRARAHAASARRRRSTFAEGAQERAEAYGLTSPSHKSRKFSVPDAAFDVHKKPSTPEAIAMARARQELDPGALSPLQQRLKSAREVAAAERKAIARDDMSM